MIHVHAIGYINVIIFVGVVFVGSEWYTVAVDGAFDNCFGGSLEAFGGVVVEVNNVSQNETSQ